MSVNVSVIASLADNALASQFAIIFPRGIPGAPSANLLKITLRQDQTFVWPKREVAKYDVFYQGLKNTYDSMTEATDKSFTLAFRLDQEWEIMRNFKAWFNLCYDDFNGTSDLEANTRVPMIVQEFGALKALKYQETFQGVKINGIKPTDNNQEGTDPMRVEVDFIYHYIDPAGSI